MNIKKQICKDLNGNVTEIKSYDLEGRHSSTELFEKDKTIRIDYVYNDNNDVLSEITTYEENEQPSMRHIEKVIHHTYDTNNRLTVSVVMDSCGDTTTNTITKTLKLYAYDER